MRVLVADDDPVTVVRLRGLAESWGYTVTTAADGVTALALLRDGDDPPRLALLDWVMPGLDGIEVCRQLRSEQPGEGTYVIMLSAKHQPDDVIAGFEAGADDYLIKPFDAGELRSRLKAGLRIVDLQQRLNANIAQLTEALANVKTLSGMLPICGYCKSIRDDSNYWHRVEEYVSDHANVEFSHGICPSCLEKVLAEERGR
ncbi:MAG: PleD family two-component system response regulator [Vicinamibacterales bacterium]